MPEDVKAQEHEGWIRTSARNNGWSTMRSDSPHNSPAPKFAFARGGEVIFVWPRLTASPLSAKQQEWLDNATKASTVVEAFVWTPDDCAAATERLSREPRG